MKGGVEKFCNMRWMQLHDEMWCEWNETTSLRERPESTALSFFHLEAEVEFRNII